MMDGKPAIFRFYGNLNDFLATPHKNAEIPYSYNGAPGIKDAIEALGIPHVEVDVILVNGASVAFDYRLHKGDIVDVYPQDWPVTAAGIHHLIPPLPAFPKFVLDVHLGKLARIMRMLGFDAAYRNNYTDPEIVYCALREKRVILTRDAGLLKNRAIQYGYWVRSSQPEEQAREVILRFALAEQIKPFHRCMSCNARIDRVDKQEVLQELPPKTRRYFDEIYRCEGCRKLYWKGSHYQNMLSKIARIRR